ncbi:MAG: hypothetical protein AB7S26_24775 [Sandaracinaceae bacterium]
MKNLLRTLCFVGMTGMAFGYAGCDDHDGPAEEVGEDVDEAFGNDEGPVERAADDVEDAVDEATE